jgi:2-polyprenyl-3-methyl-5-hydroxy-6-metoxy-1,4-benzoquinol methylase
MSDRPPCDCGCANVFGSREAENDLKRYRKQGPESTTRELIDAIVAEGVEGATLLDIGAGVGAIVFELLGAGASSALSIDATEAYVDAVRGEAERRGLADRLTGRLGDFVALASEIEPADVVTLDKVVCCYPDMPALLGRASERARRMVGLVYPRRTWWNRVAARVLAAWGWLTRDPTRWYLHQPVDIDRLMAAAGYERHNIARDLIWHVVLYRRSPVK